MPDSEGDNLSPKLASAFPLLQRTLQLILPCLEKNICPQTCPTRLNKMIFPREVGEQYENMMIPSEMEEAQCPQPTTDTYLQKRFLEHPLNV